MKLTLMKAFIISGVEYQLFNDKRHLIVMRSQGNSNEDPYRWAIKTPDGWKIYLGNKYQMCIGGVYERLTPEDVARKMFEADNRMIFEGGI